LPEPPHEQLRDFSAGALDVLSRLQGSRELCERLRRLRAETEDDAFVHGDLRWDNCMQVGPSRVLLIDWELAGRGDGAADLGAALSEYLRLWAGSVPLVDPADPGRLEAQARHPLERLQPAMRALWAGYRRGRAVSLRRVAEHAGVRLLQTAMEYAQGLVTATAEVVTLLQLADNVLRSPDHAAWALMGLRE
jgi:aminoglycoside phosphotransferase (APT) family kinase protein